jgi:hypothetical protein
MGYECSKLSPGSEQVNKKTSLGILASGDRWVNKKINTNLGFLATILPKCSKNELWGLLGQQKMLIWLPLNICLKVSIWTLGMDGSTKMLTWEPP